MPWRVLSQPTRIYLPINCKQVPGFSTSYCWLPSDHSSRNDAKCKETTCQICSFVSQSMESVVRTTSLSDIMDCSTKLPFTTRSVWLTIQPECPDLRSTCAHLRQATRSSRKTTTNIKDIKRYLNGATIASDGLLVVKRNKPFVPAKDLMIIPRSVLYGLLTSIHLQLSHPSANQMKIVMKRFFFALDIEKALIEIQQLVLTTQQSRKSHTLLLDRPHLIHLRPLAVYLQLTL